MGETIGKWLTAAAGAATLAGGGLYAVIWFSYVAYYQKFGLQPKDVGLGQADIVRTVAVGVVIFFAVAFPVFAVVWILAGFIARGARAWFGAVDHVRWPWFARRIRWTRTVADVRTVAVVGGAIVLPFVSRFFNNYVFRSSYAWRTWAAVAAVVVAALFSALHGERAWSWSPSTIAGWLAAFGIAFYCLVQILVIRSNGLAYDLISDGSPDSSYFLFDFRADPVCVGDPKSALFYRLMGTSGQGVVLFDTTTKKAIRLRSAPRIEFEGQKPADCPAPPP